jgi:hypothetical protein
VASLCSREPPPPPCPVCARAQECKWKARYYYATSLLVTPSFCGHMREGHGLEDAVGARLRGRRRESLRPDREAWSSKCNSGCNKPRLTRNNKRGEGGTPPSALQGSSESVSRTSICMVCYVKVLSDHQEQRCDLAPLLLTLLQESSESAARTRTAVKQQSSNASQ